jgi:hypothetical protein
LNLKRLFCRHLIQLALYLLYEKRRECLQATPLDMPSFADALNRIGFFLRQTPNPAFQILNSHKKTSGEPEVFKTNLKSRASASNPQTKQS